MIGITTSCEKHDHINVPDVVATTFQKSFPNISPEWDYEAPYYVAEFKYNNNETEAWYNADGSWAMTVTELPSSKLPAAISQAISTSKYAAWKYDEVKLIDRNGFDKLYKVEMEEKGSSDNEVTLYYAENGTLVKEVPDIDKDNVIKPMVLPQQIQSYLDQNFPAAQYRVVDVDIDDVTGNYEVEVLKGLQVTEIVFSSQQVFLYSEYEINWADVPVAVQNGFSAAGYTRNQIDDIYNRTTADNQTVYVFEVEVGNKDLVVIFDAEGKPVK